MMLKIFNTRMSADNLQNDQENVNTFMESVTVKKTAAQFVPGNPDYWSILLFYNPGDANVAQPKNAELAKPKELTETDLTEEQKQILAALRLWRKDKAAEINLPDFMICHNATLLSISRETPRSLEKLSEIKGLGTQKLAKYGEDILAILNAF